MPWYALYTRPRHEKKVQELLTEKGIDAFLPMIKSLRQWKDRRKWVDMPLTALQTHGVVKIVDFGGVPAAIPDWQIEQLKRLIDNADTLMPEQYLKIGDYVEVKSGSLAGIRGYLREIRGEWRVAIMVDGIYQSTSFVVDRANVQKIELTEKE